MHADNVWSIMHFTSTYTKSVSFDECKGPFWCAFFFCSLAELDVKLMNRNEMENIMRGRIQWIAPGGPL